MSVIKCRSCGAAFNTDDFDVCPRCEAAYNAPNDEITEKNNTGLGEGTAEEKDAKIYQPVIAKEEIPYGEIDSTIKRALTLIDMDEYGRAEAVLNMLIENHPEDSRCWVTLYLCESRNMTNDKPDYDKLKRCILNAKRTSNGHLDSDFEAKADAYVKKLADKAWTDQKNYLLSIVNRLKEQIVDNKTKLLQVTDNEERQLDDVEESTSEIERFKRTITRCRISNAIARLIRLFALILLVYAVTVFAFERKIGFVVGNANVSKWASTIRDYIHKYIMQYIIPVLEKYFPKSMPLYLMIVIVAAALMFISLLVRVSGKKERIKRCKRSLKELVSKRDNLVNGIRNESKSRKEPYQQNIEKNTNMYESISAYADSDAGAAYWLEKVSVRLGYKDRVDEQLEAKHKNIMEKLI